MPTEDNPRALSEENIHMPILVGHPRNTAKLRSPTYFLSIFREQPDQQGVTTPLVMTLISIVDLKGQEASWDCQGRALCYSGLSGCK
jgi:hypothetical protein